MGCPWTDHPAVRCQRRLPELPLIVEATIELPSRPQTLWVIHTDAQITDSSKLRKSQLTFIANLVRAHGANKLLVVGDFNATWGSKVFREILDDGMIDGAAARGRALDMTWSQTKAPLPRSSESTTYSPDPGSRSPPSGPAIGPETISAI